MIPSPHEPSSDGEGPAISISAGSDTDTVLGTKKVQDFQENIQIDEDQKKITGTSHHVTDFEDFNPSDSSEQSGNYLYLSFAGIDADKITTKIIGGKHANEVDCTSDKWCLYFLTESCTAIVVTATKGDKATTKSYDISELDLEEA